MSRLGDSKAWVSKYVVHSQRGAGTKKAGSLPRMHFSACLLFFPEIFFSMAIKEIPIGSSATINETIKILGQNLLCWPCLRFRQLSWALNSSLANESANGLSETQLFWSSSNFCSVYPPLIIQKVNKTARCDAFSTDNWHLFSSVLCFCLQTAPENLSPLSKVTRGAHIFHFFRV